MSLSALIATPPMGISAPQTRTFSRQKATVHLRLGSAAEGQDVRWLSWLVAITASFLVVGIVGFSGNDAFMPLLLSGARGEGAGDTASMEAVMMDLPSESVAEETSVEETVTEVVPVPMPLEVQEQPLDLPELAEALVTEDVFVIPSAPKVETALRPVDPVQAKPEVKTSPKRSSAPRTSSNSRGSGTASSPGGSGGAGATGLSASRGSFVIPRPSYPSSLRSLGIQGTVRLSISVGISGRAESVSILSSSGNSTLDQFVASWARRNGRGPAGAPGTVIAPFSFVLR